MPKYVVRNLILFFIVPGDPVELVAGGGRAVPESTR